MFSWLKKHFIPHEGNDHRPHFLREKNVRNIATLIILLEIFAFLFPVILNVNHLNNMALVLPAVLDDLTNQEREIQKLPNLSVSAVLTKAAQMKAEDMASKGYFAHTSPEGKTPWYWLSLAGYSFQYAGENLAINFSDSKDVTDAWMASPGHRANIVKGNYTEIGTGVATGIYEGKEAVFVAQVYANPLPVEHLTPVLTSSNKKVSTNKIAIVPVSKNDNVLGAEVSPNKVPVEKVTNQKASFVEEFLASPRNNTNAILLSIFVFVLFVLCLYILVKMRNHHKDIITNGLILLSVIGMFFVTNYYMTHQNMVVAQALDYSVSVQ